MSFFRGRVMLCKSPQTILLDHKFWQSPVQLFMCWTTIQRLLQQHLETQHTKLIAVTKRIQKPCRLYTIYIAFPRKALYMLWIGFWVSVSELLMFVFLHFGADKSRKVHNGYNDDQKNTLRDCCKKKHRAFGIIVTWKKEDLYYMWFFIA